MKNKTAGICVVLGVLSCSGIAVAQARPVQSAPAYTDEQITEAIAGCTRYLWSQVKADGSWEAYKSPNTSHNWPCGPSALACYALLAAGEKPKSPRMKKTIDWLVEHMAQDTMNYTVGIRCNVWLQVNRRSKDIYLKLLEKDVLRLLRTSAALGGGGGYYTLDVGETLENQKPKGPEQWAKVTKQYVDHSNGQYTVLGVWAGAQNRMDNIPPQFWTLNMKYWMERQNPDGGWAYQWKTGGGLGDSCGAMTAAGLATLFVCFDQLSAKRFTKCNIPKGPEWRAMQKGLDWFDKNFSKTLTQPWCLHDQNSLLYYLYGIERVGLASGYRYFGKVDWLKEGNRRILSIQGRDGSIYNRVADTAFALLFLIRGRRPMLLNKLEAPSFDWNNRPRDCANLTKWMSRKFETRFRWQIVTLQSPVNDWHEAPLLYISGSKKPIFTDPQLEKIRRYVLQGGTLLTVTECDGRAFKSGIRKVYQKLFPKLEMVPVGKEHELTKIHSPLKGRPKLYMIHNGIRPLAIHCDRDLPKQWQLNRYRISKRDFQAVANLYLHQTDKNMKFRGTKASWPEVPTTTSQTVKIARIRHANRYDPEPLAYERFARLMGNRHGVKVELAAPKEKPETQPLDAKVESVVWDALIPAGELKDHSDVKFAHLTGTGALPLTDEEKAALKSFVNSGGTLLIDAAGSSQTFADAARKFIAATWEGELTTLEAGHALYTLPDMTIPKVKFRRQTQKRFSDKGVPQLQAVLIDKRPAVIFSELDLTAGLVGFDNYSTEGYAPKTAFDLLRNMVLFSQTSAP